ncbi:uncharacterized protein LOC107362613 [Tetranychus urticae]|uniref:Major facilitator superfamily (MFS) profile domain-containing protein n=1 Tax=Tetranychus urticae TaxID=32264 RepID=T1KAI0_TETUR|nr:uncharacterized protein LOC107362613 [Tetranychus urticae]
MIKLTRKDVISMFKLLRVDVFLVLFNISSVIVHLSLNQLVEDKICLNELKLNQSICLNIENVDESREADKNYVLTRAAYYKNYQSLMITLPGIFLNLFVGCWLDSYPEHTKFILAVPTLGIFMDALLTIINCLQFKADYRFILIAAFFRGMGGDISIIYVGVYAYVTRKTLAEFRAVRFAVLEFFSAISFPISIYLGGLTLTSKPWIAGQPRNYIGVYILSGAFSLLAAVWALVLLNDSGEAVKQEEDEQNGVGKESYKTSKLEAKTPSKPGKCLCSFIHAFSKIFKYENLKAMMHTCFKKRENGLRCRIWHTIAIAFFILSGYLSEVAIGFPFAQKVYHWNAKYYSKISPLFMLLTSISSSVVTPILVSKFAITDTKLSIIGCISLISSAAIRGFWLSSTGYIVSHSVGVLSGLQLISMRSFLARMIKSDEIGQIYSLLAAIEAFSPLLCNIFFTTVFNATISFNPGIAYLISSASMIYPLVVDIWLDWTKSSWY